MAHLPSPIYQLLIKSSDRPQGEVRFKPVSALGAHNRHAKGSGGVRIVVCQLPIKSPWLNRIEPHWVHAKRAIVEPHRLLSKTELVNRICSYFNCKYAEHLQQVIAKKVA